jgi:hypothetical protein
MLQKLQQVAGEGNLRITHAYLGHIKKEEEQKRLFHAETLPWEEVDGAVRAVLESHLYGMIEGTLGEVNFPCNYTGDVLSVLKVASPEYDRTRNRPSVEVLEAIRDLKNVKPDEMTEWGNILAYKVMAAGAIGNHLVAILKFAITPSLGAEPVPFSFATIVDLDDREESRFDEGRSRFVTQLLTNVIKRAHVSRAVLFPCLDEDGREMADMLVYAASGAAAWFNALEATRRLPPRREGAALVRMITEQASGGDVPHDLFAKMEQELLDEAPNGLAAESVAEAVEQAVGHGIDRLGFQARWESAFGGLEYRPSFDSLFGDGEVYKPTKLKMQAGEITVTLTPGDLEHFRQVTVGDETYILFRVPERAKVQVGKDLALQIKPVALEQVTRWMQGEQE